MISQCAKPAGRGFTRAECATKPVPGPLDFGRIRNSRADIHVTQILLTQFTSVYCQAMPQVEKSLPMRVEAPSFQFSFSDWLRATGTESVSP